MFYRAAAPLAFVALFTLATAASAASGQDQALAETLFQDAKRLVAAGDVAGALPKFLESQRIDPSTGTLLNIGDCYEKLGKLASAWGIFKEAESSAKANGQTDRAGEAARRAGLLSLKLSKLAIVVPPFAKVPGFEVKRDGATVGEAQWGSPLPVDAGQHTIEASAPGYKSWTTTVRVETDGASTSIAVQPLAKETSLAPPGNDGAPFWNGQRIAGFTIGAVGVVGGAIGAALAANAESKDVQSKLNCDPVNPNICNATGVSVRSSALSVASASTGVFIASGVLFAGGVVVFATASKKVEIAPSVGTVTLRGKF